MSSALLILALFVTGETGPRYMRRDCSRAEGGRTQRGFPCGGEATAEAATYFEFAPESGAGLPVAEDLCDALAAEVPGWSTPVDGGAGNWCLKGNGTTATGSEVAFEAVGSPTITTATVCPSGPDCATKDVIQLSSTSAYAATAARASGTGPMTVCRFASDFTVGSQPYTVSHVASTPAAGSSWHIDILSITAWRFLVSNGSSFGVASKSRTSIDGEPVFVCGTHAGGTAAPKIYVDGTAGTDGSSVARQSVSAKPTINGYSATVNSAVSAGTNNFGTFYVDQELSAAQIAAIARRVLADQPKALIRGSPSLAMTYTRTGSMFCSKADNTGSILPANRPCIARNGLLVETAGTNLLHRSQEIDNAAWSKFGAGVAAPTVTANYAAAPDGTMTADRVQVNACPTDGNRSLVYQGADLSATGVTGTVSVFIKGTSGSGTVAVVNADDSDTPLTLCAFTASAWVRCTSTDTNSLFLSKRHTLLIGCENAGIVPNKQNTGAADILVWGGQLEEYAVATSYTPTTSAAATRGLALPYFDLGGTVGPSAEKFSAALTSLTAGAVAGQTYAYLFRASAAQTDTSGKGVWLYSNATAGATMRCFTGNDAAGAIATSSIAGVAGRAACWTDGTALNFTWGANTATPAGASAGTYTPTRWVDIGQSQGLSTLGAFGGFLGKVCFDSRSTRCR